MRNWQSFPAWSYWIAGGGETEAPLQFYRHREAVVRVNSVESFSKVLPVFLLFIVGMLLRHRQMLSSEAIRDFKKLVVNLTLPLALFLTFSGVALEARHAAIFATVFIFCTLAMLFGKVIGPRVGIASPLFPLLMTGFEAGMMGYAIFAAVYGADQLYKFGIVDLGQVTFVFFVLVAMLERLSKGSPRRSIGQISVGFILTPVIVAILLGIAFNQLHWTAPMRSSAIGAGIFQAAKWIAEMTTPLVGIIIGYEMRLKRGALALPIRTIAIRMALWVPIGLLVNALLIDRILHLDRTFQAAVMTMFILPPPFVIPLFLKDSDEAEQTYAVNTLSLATIVTLFAFAIVTAVYSR